MTPQLHHIERLFPELSTYSEDQWRALGTDQPTLMIAMTARTGSSHLCSSLASIYKIGKPVEIFNARDFLVWKKGALDLKQYSDFLTPYIDASQDFVCFKTNWIDFDFFADKIPLMFPNLQYVYLERIDIEAQAVSLFKAMVSQVWHDSPDHAKTAVRNDPEVARQFNLAKICQAVRSIEREKRIWEQYFFGRGLQPVRLYYDLFIEDVQPAVRTIIDHLGLPERDTAAITSQYKRLSDKISEQWLGQVRQYRSGQSSAAAPDPAARVKTETPAPPLPITKAATPEFYNDLMTGGALNGKRLPRWPDETVQRTTTGAAGLVVLQRAANFAARLEVGGAFARQDWKGLGFGCGWGQVATVMLLRGKASQLDICDHSRNMVETCRAAGFRNRIFQVPYTLNGELAKAAYDFCYADNMFGHYDRATFENNLRALLRCVKPGGSVYIAVRHQQHLNNLVAAGQVPADTDIPQDGFGFFPRSRDSALGDTVVTPAYMEQLGAQLGQIESLGPVDVEKYLYRLTRPQDPVGETAP